MYFYLYLDRAGEYRWSLHAGNNRTLADSGEGYRTKQGAMNAMNLIAGNTTIPVRFGPGVK